MSEGIKKMPKMKRKLNYDEFVSENVNNGENFTNQLIIRSDRSPLHRIRKQQGFTLEVLAKAAGISASYLSRIEARTRRMNEEIINRLCMVLKCSPVQLIASQANQYEAFEYKATNAICDLPVYQTIAGDAIPGGNPNDTYLNINTIEEKVFRPTELTAEKAAFAVSIINNENAPKFRKGDLIYINPSLECQIGYYVILLNHHKRYFIGELIEKTISSLSIKVSGNNAQTHKFLTEDVKVMYAICMTIESYSR